jgi:hypothetical protein
LRARAAVKGWDKSSSTTVALRDRARSTLPSVEFEST